MKITNSPNMVCMVNHAAEDLQYRILDFALPCENGKSKGRLRWQREQYRARREKQKSNSNPGWQDGGNMTGADNFRHLQLVHCHARRHVSTPADIIVFQLLHM